MKDDEKRIDDLVKKAQRGDKEAFSKLYDEFLNPIYRYIFFRVSSELEAEDLTEEVFLKILSGLKNYKKRKNMPFSAWIFRIAKNIVIDFYRRHVRIEEVNEETIDETGSGDPRQKIESVFDKKRLKKALKELPTMQAEVISLKFFADRENDEIAKVLGKTEGAIRILQSRGLKKLKEIMKEDEI